jgi:hypothetical protein
MSQPVPGYDRWQRDDDAIPKQRMPWYVLVLGIAAVAILVLTIVGFWIAGRT